ncbi:hypothetical protein [Loigolactobacillus iwatensis]|uniref:hypothetical protein n=1 Tax=Loigolactobacillus iwatensis TaxID=1267156 RepID=UPI000F7DFDFF|nr:hypothetical protein [Loigolactobacillus iwatensis]
MIFLIIGASRGLLDLISIKEVLWTLRLGAMLSGLLFGRLFTWLQARILVVVFTSLALAMVLIAIANFTWLTVIGAGLFFS